MPETLKEFIEKKVAELEGLSVGAVGFRSWLRTALRKAADHGFEHGWKAGCMPDCELLRDWQTYRGTNDQPYPTQDGNHTL